MGPFIFQHRSNSRSYLEQGKPYVPTKMEYCDFLIFKISSYFRKPCKLFQFLFDQFRKKNFNASFLQIGWRAIDQI